MLEAAKILCARSGVDARIREIATQAGVGLGTPYRRSATERTWSQRCSAVRLMCAPDRRKCSLRNMDQSDLRDRLSGRATVSGRCRWDCEIAEDGSTNPRHQRRLLVLSSLAGGIDHPPHDRGDVGDGDRHVGLLG